MGDTAAPDPDLHDDLEEEEESEDEAELQWNQFVPRMLNPICEDASRKTHWIHGEFPSARAGIALADNMRGSSRSFYMFGGAQYVHQEWYADLYEFTLSGASPCMLGTH